MKQGAQVKAHAGCSCARASARHAMPINDMRTQACVHDVRVRLTDCLLQSRKEFGASTMNRRTGGVPAITVVRFRSSAVRTVKVWEDEVNVCGSQARDKAGPEDPLRAGHACKRIKLVLLQKWTCMYEFAYSGHFYRLNFASLHFHGGRAYALMKPRSRGPKRAENRLFAGQIPNTRGASPRGCQTAKVRANPIVESNIPSSFVRCMHEAVRRP